MTNKKEYFERLTNKLFRLLPIYEGKDKETNLIVYEAEVAHQNFLNNLTAVITEVSGLRDEFKDSAVDELFYLLKGMEDIKVNQHPVVKTCVFKAINQCKRVGDA